MKRKKLLCALLTLILLFSIKPAAAALTDVERATVIEASTRLPVIRVSVPTSASVYINPLELTVRIGGESADEQIISSYCYLANRSEVPIDVDVTVTGSVKEGSDMTLVSSPTGGTGTSKNAFIYFQMQQTNTSDRDEVRWDAVYDATKHIIVRNGSPQSKQKIVTLPAKTQDGEVAQGGYAPFRLSGDAVKKPSSAWNSKDGINAVVAFTFTPLSYE